MSWFGRWRQTKPESSVSGPNVDPVQQVRIPVFILTGFLGAGKTALLRNLLADPAMAGTAVIINEFGSIPLDHELVHAGSERYVVTTSGCICCVATSDIRRSLHDLWQASGGSWPPAFSRVIVETTGLADPAPIVNSLLDEAAISAAAFERAIAGRFVLSGVVTALDVSNGDAALSEHIEGLKQIAFADRIILTKADLVDPALIPEWAKRIEMINPGVAISNGHDSLRIRSLFADRSYEPDARGGDVLGWLAMESHRAGHEEHEHDPNRHGDRIMALPLFHEEPLDRQALVSFLDILTTQQAVSGLLRLKGITATEENPHQPLIIHAVGHRLYPLQKLDEWPSEDRRSRLILIGTDLPVEPIQELFATLVPRSFRRKAKRIRA